MVEQTVASGFTVEEVAADKAYLSHDNLNLVASLGGTAFIPFQINSVQGEAGTVWEKMYLFYALHREEFLTHYDRRSNVESVFSMVKAKFGDFVRSRMDTAMRNEVYCKFIAHTICCVLMSQVELGIEPVFWERVVPVKAETELEMSPASVPEPTTVEAPATEETPTPPAPRMSRACVGA